MGKPNSAPAGLLDAIEQYAAAVEQDVRSKLRFTSYAARDASKRKRKEKQQAVRAAIAALTSAPSARDAELVALAEKWRRMPLPRGLAIVDAAHAAYSACADELTALAQKGDARGQG